MDTVKAKRKIDIKHWIPILISLFLMTAFGYVVPPWGPVTQKGVAVLGVFAGTILLIVSGNGLMWPSILSFCALVWVGYAPASTLMTSFLGNATVLQLMFIMAVAAGLVSSGTANVIAKKIISSRFARKSPFLFTMALMLGFMVVGCLVNSTAGILFAFPLVDGITQVQGYKKDDEYPRFLILGCYMMVILGLAVFPHNMIISSIVATFSGSLKGTAYQFSYGLHIVIAVAVELVFIVCYVSAMRFIFRVDYSKSGSFDPTKVEGMSKEDCTLTTDQKIFLSAFVIGLMQPILIMILPASNGLRKWLEMLSLPVWFALVVVVLSNIRVKGRRIFVTETIFKEGVFWYLIISVGSLLVLGGALSSKETGIQAWLTQIIGPLVKNMSWPMFVLLAVLLCSFITNFFSNLATGVIVATIMAPFAVTYMDQGINIQPLCVGMCIASMTAYLTVAAYTTAPLLLSRESMPNRWIWTKGLLAIIVEIIVNTAVVSLLGYIL